MRMRNFTLFCGLLLLVGAVAPSVALGHTSKAAYDWHVGDALLQSIGFPVGNQLEYHQPCRRGGTLRRAGSSYRKDGRQPVRC